MIRSLILAATLTLAACNSTLEKIGGFSPEMFASLDFLEGRWTGVGPDGAPFYDQYDFPDPTTFRSQRFDASFTKASDTSTVTLEDGRIISRWGDYSWKAVDMADGYIAFAPVNAPGSFQWKRIDADTVEVMQRFTDKDGKPQSYAITLKRIG